MVNKSWLIDNIYHNASCCLTVVSTIDAWIDGWVGGSAIQVSTTCAIVPSAMASPCWSPQLLQGQLLLVESASLRWRLRPAAASEDRWRTTKRCDGSPALGRHSSSASHHLGAIAGAMAVAWLPPWGWLVVVDNGGLWWLNLLLIMVWNGLQWLIYWLKWWFSMMVDSGYWANEPNTGLIVHQQSWWLTMVMFDG